MNNNVHEGHRKRVTQRVLNHGFGSLTNIEKIEFLLYFTRPRINTNPLAHALLDHFGSLTKLMEASPYDLMKVDGIGQNSALLLSSILPLMKEYLIDSMGPKLTLKNSNEIRHYFEALCMGNKYECAYALYLDKSMHVLKVDKLSEGTLDSTQIYTDKIVEGALLYGAYYVVLGHNHTSGYIMPSPNDIKTTQAVVDALFTIRKYLLDAIIVDHTNSISFAELGFISDFAVVDPYEKPNVHIETFTQSNRYVNFPILHDEDDG